MKLNTIFYSLILLFFMVSIGLGQYTIFFDDFSNNTSDTWTTSGQIGSSSWYVNRSGDDWGARISTSQRLELTNDASGSANADGWVFAYINLSSLSSPFTSTISNNPGLVTWTFNMRQIRDNPAGFSSGSYGVAFILGGTHVSPNNYGSGYAVVLGQSGTTDPIRLVKFNNGLSGSLTNLITSNTSGLTDFGNEYLSIKVTYNPSNNQWELFLRNDGLSGFSDPETGTLTSQGTIVDNSYTNTQLYYLGAYWQGSTAANQTAYFDNVKITVTLSPVSDVTLTGTGSGTGNISWTLPSIYSNSNNEIIVFLKEGSAINIGSPTNNINSYTASSTFGSGSAYENDGNAFCIYKGDGNSVNVTGITDNQTYYALIFNTDGASAYSMGVTSNGVLPVRLISFEIINYFNEIKLRWITATEIQNYGWEIERIKGLPSQKNSHWEKIGFVAGSGNSNSPKEYFFLDKDRLYGEYSYRLKQIDIDGSFSYSDPVSIKVGEKPLTLDLKNYPNPFNPETTIEFELPTSTFVNLSVYNSIGQKIATVVNDYYEEGIYKKIFDGSIYPSGIYFCILKTNERSVIRKIMLVK